MPQIPVRSKYSNVLKPWVDGATRAERPWEDVTNQILDRVTLCYGRFRMFCVGRGVQPATMIGFKQIEFFDHTGDKPSEKLSRLTRLKLTH